MRAAGAGAALAFGLVSAAPAVAQLVLPGATGSTPQGAVQAPAPRAAAVPKGPEPGAGARVVADDQIIGKTLMLNGNKGRIQLERRDKGAQVRFIAVGDKISNRVEACGLDLGGGQPLPLTPVGRPDGVIRYKVELATCPVTLDVLEDAVLVGGVGGACRFEEADCSVDPRGLWGLPAASLEPRVKEIDAHRGVAEKTVRQNFKALLSRTKKEDVKAVAAEQAGFTSERETVCRDYAREAVHGFCGARFTEWRAASLAARINRLDGKPEGTAVAEAAKPKPRPKPKPEATVAGGPDSAPPPPRQPVREPTFFERLFR